MDTLPLRDVPRSFCTEEAAGTSGGPRILDPGMSGYTPPIPQARGCLSCATVSRPGGATRRGAHGEGAVVVYEVIAASVEWNPSAERLRELTEKMPNSQVTEFGNVVVKARVDSRSTRSTFVVDDSTNATKQTITREVFELVAAEQDAFIATTDVVVVDGYIGSNPEYRTRARLIMESANANVAGMQKQLYYPVD